MLGVLRIHRVAEPFKRDSEVVPRIGKHQDVAEIFLVPEQVPSTDVLLVHHRLVIDHANRSPCIGHRIFVGRVVHQVSEIAADVFKVGNIVKIELFEHPFPDHPGDHVIARHNDVIACAAVAQARIDLLVGGKGRIVDLDAGQLLKLGDHGQAVVRPVRDILPPVMDIDRLSLSLKPGVVTRIPDLYLRRNRQSGTRQQQHRGAEKADHLFHIPIPLLPRWFSRSMRVSWRLTSRSTVSTTIKMMAESALISGLTLRRVIAKMVIGRVWEVAPATK